MGYTVGEFIIIFGLIVMSYLFGRFSHLIPLSFFQKSLKNTSKTYGKTTGKYSSDYYKNNKLEHTKLVSLLYYITMNEWMNEWMNYNI